MKPLTQTGTALTIAIAAMACADQPDVWADPVRIDELPIEGTWVPSGWMGDAQWTAEEAALNLDMGSLYYNWVRTMADVQEAGCTHSTPDSHGQQNMSGYCWVCGGGGGGGGGRGAAGAVAGAGVVLWRGRVCGEAAAAGRFCTALDARRRSARVAVLGVCC